MSVAEQIVDVLLEADEIDPKNFFDRHAGALFNLWEQTGGDRDWWTYGGTFHNPGLGEMLHVSGMEQEGLKEIEHWDIELTPEEQAQLEVDYPVKIDPDFPEDGDENERDRDLAKETIQMHHADQLNENRKIHVYRWTDDFIEDWADKFDDISRSIGTQVSELPLPAQWEAIGDYFGWEELDYSPTMMTKAELEKLLEPPTETSPPPDHPQDIQ
jgi:hypothetical protein